MITSFNLKFNGKKHTTTLNMLYDDYKKLSIIARQHDVSTSKLINIIVKAFLSRNYIK